MFTFVQGGGSWIRDCFRKKRRKLWHIAVFVEFNLALLARVSCSINCPLQKICWRPAMRWVVGIEQIQTPCLPDAHISVTMLKSFLPWIAGIFTPVDCWHFHSRGLLASSLPWIAGIFTPVDCWCLHSLGWLESLPLSQCHVFTLLKSTNALKLQRSAVSGFPSFPWWSNGWKSPLTLRWSTHFTDCGVMWYAWFGLIYIIFWLSYILAFWPLYVFKVGG